MTEKVWVMDHLNEESAVTYNESVAQRWCDRGFTVTEYVKVEPVVIHAPGVIDDATARLVETLCGQVAPVTATSNDIARVTCAACLEDISKTDTAAGADGGNAPARQLSEEDVLREQEKTLAERYASPSRAPQPCSRYCGDDHCVCPAKEFQALLRRARDPEKRDKTPAPQPSRAAPAEDVTDAMVTAARTALFEASRQIAQQDGLIVKEDYTVRVMLAAALAAMLDQRREGMLAAAEIAETFGNDILVLYDRPGGPPGNSRRALQGKDVASAIRAAADAPAPTSECKVCKDTGLTRDGQHCLCCPSLQKAYAPSDATAAKTEGTR